MKTTTIRDLCQSFGKVSNWLEAGETVQFLKRGKPFARIEPVKIDRKTLLDTCPSPFPLPADIDDPVDVEWEAMK